MFARLSVPTPFQIGPVNAYLAGRTLVDPGPDSDEAWARLLAALEERELAPDDVERVLVTHPHPDHFGIAHRFRDAGARVLASPAAADVVDDFPARLAYEQSYFADFFERCGMGSETAAADAVAGHAPGELIFAYDDGDGRTALVGDHVLPDVTPTPFLQPPPERGGSRPRVLPAYNDSLARLRGEPLDRFLPGHGDPIDAPRARVETILAAHEDRTEAVADVVDGPTAPVEVMDGLFGDLPATEAFSGMSEAVGHLDVLEASGRVRRREKGGVVVYEPI